MPPFFKSVTRTGCFLLAGLTLLLTAGCATHSVNAGMAINRLKAGDTTSALHWSEKLKRSMFSQDLGYLESGRIKMLSGDFAGSRADFATVIDRIIEETETGPVIRLGSVGTTAAASTVTDDSIRKYQLSPYEIIQLLHYQTLNYLFNGDPDGAGVEMRRTVFAQNAIAEKYSKEIEKDQEQADSTQVQAMETVQAKMETLGPVLERTSSSYENGLAWYVCGLVFEKQGDAANAALSYRKAWERAPENSCILKDFLRMLRTQDSQAFIRLAARNHVDVKSLTRGPSEIVVLYEDSLISQRIAEKITVPVPDFEGIFTLLAIDFPFYNDAACSPEPLTITADGTVLGVTEPAVYLQSLAYRDLKDKMPGIVVRNITRAATKIIAQQAANNQNDDLMRFGVLVANSVSALASAADTRAWYSIPMNTQLYRGSIPAGAHTLQFRNPSTGTVLTVPVTVAEGETRLIWIADTGGMAVAATASLTGKGLPPDYHQFNNPFWTSGAPGSVNDPAAISPVGQ